MIFKIRAVISDLPKKSDWPGKIGNPPPRIAKQWSGVKFRPGVGPRGRQLQATAAPQPEDLPRLIAHIPKILGATPPHERTWRGTVASFFCRCTYRSKILFPPPPPPPLPKPISSPPPVPTKKKHIAKFTNVVSKEIV